MGGTFSTAGMVGKVLSKRLCMVESLLNFGWGLDFRVATKPSAKTGGFLQKCPQVFKLSGCKSNAYFANNLY